MPGRPYKLNEWVDICATTYSERERRRSILGSDGNVGTLEGLGNRTEDQEKTDLVNPAKL